MSAPSYPNTTDITLAFLALMGAQSGVLTDYNPGSIVRTQAESLGSVIELQGIQEQTLAYQTMVYGAMTAMGITPRGASYATGVVTLSAPGPVPYSIAIASGSIVQTQGGIQFYTITNTSIASGNQSTSVGVQAVSGGVGGNVPAGAITALVTSVGYPITATNGLPTAGGAPAEALSQTLARFAAAVAAPGLCSPVAVANGAIGIITGAESVQFANTYEPWIAAGSGAASGTPGFTLYIDDGTGTASSALITAVENAISGTPGFRPVGVPYSVLAGTPVYATISVTGTMLSAYDSASGTTSNAVSGAIVAYASSLPFASTLYLGNISAIIGNAGEGQLANFSAVLSYASGATGVSSITGSYSGRVVLSSVSVSLT